MLGVVVDLVAGKEEDISVDSLNILDNILTRDIASVARLNGVSRESRDDNFIFVDWIFADDSLILCLRTMEDTVLSRLCVVPILNAERCGPPRLDHVGLRDFRPFSVLFDL